MIQRFIKSRAIRAVYVIYCALFLTNCVVENSNPNGAEKPNVLIITIDTCRADRLGCYGYGLARTPAIDGLANDGVLCTDAIAPAPVTMPSHASIMTGLYPPAHGVRDNGAFALADEAVTLAERLKEGGYATHAVVSAAVLDRRYNLTQGFDGYDDELWAEDDPKMFMIRDRPAPKSAARAVAWLESWREQSGRPFFLWTHFFDPHQPYEADVSDAHLLPTLYDQEIAQADEGVARIIGWLEENGLLDDTFVVLTADHGESLGEHQEKTHAIFIYDATVRVPLIFRYPEALPRGTRFEGPVRSIDIMPTVLGALGMEPGGAVQGSNMLPALRGAEPPPELSQYSEAMVPHLGFGMAPLFGIRSGGYKYIRAPRPELYALETDPRELENIIENHPTVTRALSQALDEVMADSAERSLDSAAQNPLDVETLEMLQAMGYMASPAEQRAMEGMDPKDGLALYQKLESARHLAQRSQWEESEALLRELTAEIPHHIAAHNTLGLVRIRQGRLDDAEQAYLDSLAIEARQHRVLHMLGHINLVRGDLDRAEGLFRRALAIAPRFVESMVQLGFVAAQRNDEEMAQQWYEKALAEDVHEPRAQLGFAELYFMRDEYEEALRYFELALQRTPNHLMAILRAGVCCMRMGELERAGEYIARARELRPDSWLPFYDLACLRVREQRNEAALDALTKAVAVGKGSAQLAALLQSDRDLAPLRPDDAFNSIVSEAIRAATRQRQDEAL